jgi:hypothetical protein
MLDYRPMAKVMSLRKVLAFGSVFGLPVFGRRRMAFDARIIVSDFAHASGKGKKIAKEFVAFGTVSDGSRTRRWQTMTMVSEISRSGFHNLTLP